MEEYFWNTREKTSSKQLFVLVIYDIINNKRRTKFAKEMNGYGEVKLFGQNAKIEAEEVIII